MINEYTRNQMFTAMEYGYLQCERGNNLQKAVINFAKDLDLAGKPPQAKEMKQNGKS